MCTCFFVLSAADYRIIIRCMGHLIIILWMQRCMDVLWVDAYVDTWCMNALWVYTFLSASVYTHNTSMFVASIKHYKLLCN